jgi:ABC-type uncharacterized transport system substrate-binding protein
MKRREFVVALGCVGMLALAAQAQQKLPIIGMLNASPSSGVAAAVRAGLAEQSFVEGRDYLFEYRGSSRDQKNGIEVNAGDLVRSGVSLIVVWRVFDALIAKAATSSIPIVFSVGGDPVATGLVGSLNRPGGNLTGNANLNIDLIGKRLEILHEFAPTASTIGFIVNPINITYSEAETKQLQTAARALGVRLLIETVTAPSEFDSAFAHLAQAGVSALVVSGDSLFYNNRDQLNVLAAQFALPSIYPNRAWATEGGLVSYGTDYTEGYRLIGIYAGRILKGERPSELPVQQITKIDFVINLKAAKTLGITIPPSLLARADEVIE